MLRLSAFGECRKGYVLVVTGHRNTAAVKFVANCVRRLILGNVQTDDPDRFQSPRSLLNETSRQAESDRSNTRNLDKVAVCARHHPLAETRRKTMTSTGYAIICGSISFILITRVVVQTIQTRRKQAKEERIRQHIMKHALSWSIETQNDRTRFMDDFPE